MPGAPSSPVRSSIGRVFGHDRFGVLLALLVVAFLLPGQRGTEWPQFVGSVVNLAALTAGLGATGLWTHPRAAAMVATVGFAGTVLVASYPQTSGIAAVGALGQSVVLLAILGAVVGRVLAHDRVGSQTILGALAAYFLISLVFAWIFFALEGLLDGPILEPPIEGLPSYYSLVVLTTLGFGDISPVNEFARRVTAIEAMTGQVFLATLVARLVAMYGRSRVPGER